MKYPIIDGHPFFPKERLCPVCGSNFKKLIYLSGGMSPVKDFDLDEWETLKGFLSIGIHGSAVDVSDSANIDIVINSKGGQFDIYFCSTTCIRQWFNELVSDLEAEFLRSQGKGAEND